MSESRQQRRARERAATKTVGRPRSIAATPVTEHELVHGGPAGTDSRIRLASSADVTALEPLVELTGVPLDPYLRSALQADALAGAVRAGLREGHEALLRDIATHATQHGGEDPRALYLRSALPLVAEHPDHGIVGCLLAYPPATLVDQYVTAAAAEGASAQYNTALLGTISLIKLKAVAVAEPARGQQLGTALVQRCTQVYRQCRFTLLYGQMPPGRGLARFYAQQGFTVHGENEHLDLWVIFGRRGGIYPDQGERMFAQWL